VHQQEEEQKERIEQEAESVRRAEREKTEEEEYKKWKSLIVVEEQGLEELDDKQVQARNQTFVEYLKKNKAKELAEIAQEFKMRTHDVVDLIRELDAKGQLSGVIDDRGKFIYVTREEMEAVARYVMKKGRVSITDIAAESNRLINLEVAN